MPYHAASLHEIWGPKRITSITEGCSHNKDLASRSDNIYIGCHGWQPHSLYIHENLSIRSVMFPFCIAGFLAKREQECTFRRFFSTSESFQSLGPAKRALRLIEQVWELQDDLDENSWGLYDCFQIKGSDVLFI
ncbi:LOW QUALITY PROTEIN: hypothetical protein MKX08_007621 [Trichoderma sp. CBMAI-0020]|nr:LOW QUALITY PROTEIN: hypothetical protein MKX08_007621 [Trichoderma sp. CBMAI-0020]